MDANDSGAFIGQSITRPLGQIENDAGRLDITVGEQRRPDPLYAGSIHMLLFEADAVLNTGEVHDQPMRLAQFEVGELRLLCRGDLDLEGLPAAIEGNVFHNRSAFRGSSVDGQRGGE